MDNEWVVLRVDQILLSLLFDQCGKILDFTIN